MQLKLVAALVIHSVESDMIWKNDYSFLVDKTLDNTKQHAKRLEWLFSCRVIMVLTTGNHLA